MAPPWHRWRRRASSDPNRLLCSHPSAGQPSVSGSSPQTCNKLIRLLVTCCVTAAPLRPVAGLTSSLPLRCPGPTPSNQAEHDEIEYGGLPEKVAVFVTTLCCKGCGRRTLDDGRPARGIPVVRLVGGEPEIVDNALPAPPPFPHDRGPMAAVLAVRRGAGRSSPADHRGACLRLPWVRRP